MGGLIGLGNNPGQLAVLGSVSERLCQLGDAAQLVDVRARRDEVSLGGADVPEPAQHRQQFVVAACPSGGGCHGVDDLGRNPVHIAAYAECTVTYLALQAVVELQGVLVTGRNSGELVKNPALPSLAQTREAMMRLAKAVPLVDHRAAAEISDFDRFLKEMS
jgi:hypothetical protein